jgi:hypothetical protein
MGAEHGVDRLRREAGRRQVGQKRAVALVPVRDPAVLLVVAETGVDNDAAVAGSTIRLWMLILSLPFSSAKCGCSHSSGRIASGVACGSRNRLPPVASSSMTLVTVTSPMRHFMPGSSAALTAG